MKKVSQFSATNTIEFLSILKNVGNYSIFRGHTYSEWELIPKIGRFFDALKYYEDWETYEESILHDFKRFALPFIEKEPTNDIEWLVLGQHYGLPTRLLDWTTNPLKALFFAIEDDNADYDSTVWCLEYGFWSEELTSLKSIDGLGTFLPPHTNKRLIAQEGCFTIFPFPKEKTPIIPMEHITPYKRSITSLIKITIPNSFRKTIKIELDQFGINHSSLFPDLDGLSKHLIWQKCLCR